MRVCAAKVRWELGITRRRALDLFLAFSSFLHNTNLTRQLPRTQSTSSKMPSYLDKMASNFQSTLTSAAGKISNPSTHKAASTSGGTPKPSTLTPGSPALSQLSDGGTPRGAKRKRDVPDIPYSQPQLTGYGAEVKTQMAFAVEYLKKKGTEKSLLDIVGHLSLLSQSSEHKKQLAEGLRRHPRVEWKPDATLKEQNWQTGKYKHRPLIPGVTDGVSLQAYLQKKTDSSSTAVRDLKDGWFDCEDTLAELEGQHQLLVVRTKKDNVPRYVWADDPSLFHKVDQEFQNMWTRVQLPSVDDMHRKLTSIGQKPTNDDPRKAKEAAKQKQQQKKRTKKRIGKVTNVHMQHLMQDFSGRRP